MTFVDGRMKAAAPAAVPTPVSGTSSWRDVAPEARCRSRPSPRSAHPLVAALGAHAALAHRRPEHLDARRARRAGRRSWRSGTGASCRPPTSSATAASSSSPARTSTASGLRGIIERFGYGTARGSTSRGAPRAAAAADARHGGGQAGRVHGRRPAGPARVAQPGAVWLAKAPAIRCCRFTSRPIGTGASKLGPHADSEAVQPRAPRARRAHRRSLAG